MSASPIEILKQQMREKFPQAHGMREEVEFGAGAGKPFEVVTFPANAISEVIPAGPVSGISLLVAGLLGEPVESCPHPEFILIDGADAFDPGSFTPEACARLLWVRCATGQQMMRAADLVINDGNLSFVILDSTGLSAAELSRIPASSWRRLKMSAERNGSRIVVISTYQMVPCASLRLTLSADLSLHDFDSTREDLLARLKPASSALRRVN